MICYNKTIAIKYASKTSTNGSDMNDMNDMTPCASTLMSTLMPTLMSTIMFEYVIRGCIYSIAMHGKYNENTIFISIYPIRVWRRVACRIGYRGSHVRYTYKSAHTDIVLVHILTNYMRACSRPTEMDHCKYINVQTHNPNIRGFVLQK